MNKIKNRQIWGYGFGNFGFGIIFQITATFFVFYATAVLGFSGKIVGLMFGLGIVWDAISDPIMGYISDHTHNEKYGRRLLYLWIGGISMMVTNILLWNLYFDIPDALQMLAMVFSLLLLRTAMTIYSTPYTALGAELTSEPAKRAKIQSVRMVFFMLGIFFTASISMFLFFKPTDLYPIGQLNPAGYQRMSLSTSLIMGISMLVAIKSTYKHVAILNVVETTKASFGLIKFFTSIRDAFQHGDLRAVVFGYLFTNIASGLLSTIGLHVFTYTFGLKTHWIGIIIGSQLLFAVFTQPFWLWLIKKQDKVKVVRLGLNISIAAFVYFSLCVIFREQVAANTWLLIPFILLGGIGSGGLFTIPQAMVADTADANALKTGKHLEGIYFGTLTMTYKLSQSISILIIGTLLDAIGFDTKLPTQSAFTMTGLGLILGLGSTTALILAYYAYSKYNLTRAKMVVIQQQLSL